MPGMERAGTVEAKRAWRSAVRAARRDRAAGPGRDLADERIAQAGVALARSCAEGLVCRVTVYDARATEPPTAGLIRALRHAGCEVLLPLIRPDRVLAWDCDGTRLPPEAIGTATLVLTPGLAVDRSGRRLGQGGGYYDVALARVAPGVPVVTVLWDEEFVDGPVPSEAHDRRVDGVITPHGGVQWIGAVSPGARG